VENGVAEFPWSRDRPALRQWMTEATSVPKTKRRDCFAHVPALGALLYQVGLRCRQNPSAGKRSS